LRDTESSGTGSETPGFRAEPAHGSETGGGSPAGNGAGGWGVISVIDFLLEDLYEGGIVYHHLHKGLACTGDIWCPGCNFRILQYMDYLDDLEKNGGSATKDRP
jgi:hypothetical protein